MAHWFLVCILHTAPSGANIRVVKCEMLRVNGGEFTRKNYKYLKE